jgi:hypothetical protein
MYAYYILLVSLLGLFPPATQLNTDTLTLSLEVDQVDAGHVMELRNINGSVTIEGTRGSSIEVTVQRTIDGKTIASTARGKEEVQLGSYQTDGLTALYMRTPCTVEPAAGTSKEDYLKNRWQNWRDNCRWADEYDFQLDWTVKVPAGISVAVSTVNKGDLDIANVQGEVRANNVNGDITISEIRNKLDVHTVNGDVDLDYAQAPTDGSKYYTLNGDINMYVPGSIDARVYFKSFNGDFFTEAEDIHVAPIQVKQKKSSDKRGIKTKIEARSSMILGKGGPQLHFETFNGDVYLKNK